jgi:hypothetical protein
MRGTLSLRVAFLLVMSLNAAIGLGVAVRSLGSDQPAALAQTSEAIPPVPRPLHLYSGRCGELGAIEWPLNVLVSPNGEDRGSGARDRTEYSFTANIPVSIDAMLAGNFAINVHHSSDNMELSLSCGNIGGVTDSLGSLVIGLRRQGGTDITGIAVLSPSPVDPAFTYASVFITGGDLGDDVGTIGVESVPESNAEVPVSDAAPD